MTRPHSAHGDPVTHEDTHSHPDVQGLTAELGALMSFMRTHWARNAQDVHPELRGSGLMVLQSISRRGPITSRAICQILDMDKSTVSRLVTTLKELGFVDVTDSPADKRVSLLTLSPHGAQAFEDLRARSAHDICRRLTDWDDSEVKQLTQLLHRFNESPTEDSRR